MWDFYRIDIRDLWRGSLTPRRAVVFIKRALNEANSQLRASMFGEDWHGWTREMTLLADIYDLTQLQTQVTAQEKRPRVKSPYPRPANSQPQAKTLASLNAGVLALEMNL